MQGRGGEGEVREFRTRNGVLGGEGGEAALEREGRGNIRLVSFSSSLLTGSCVTVFFLCLYVCLFFH